MNQAEQVAMTWARNYLRGHHCGHCGKEWLTAASTRILMHSCSPQTRRRGAFELPPAEYPSMEEARAVLFGSTAGGYQPPTRDEAQQETDKGYGGRPG